MPEPFPGRAHGHFWIATEQKGKAIPARYRESPITWIHAKDINNMLKPKYGNTKPNAINKIAGQWPAAGGGLNGREDGGSRSLLTLILRYTLPPFW